MNYYEFLYRWTPDPRRRSGYFWFNCLGIVCSDCVYLGSQETGLGCIFPGANVEVTAHGWDFILAHANRLLAEGVLYK